LIDTDLKKRGGVLIIVWGMSVFLINDQSKNVVPLQIKINKSQSKK